MNGDIQTPGDRLVTLDALRGFAVMGILTMNIVAFAMPEAAYVTPTAYGGRHGADLASWIVDFILFDSKMRGLFSLLFGASLLLIAERADAKGASAAGVHYTRMIWLALFGLAHFFFLWVGDILFLYASVGCVAFLAREWSARRLLRWGIALYAAGFLLYGGLTGAMLGVQHQAMQPGASAEQRARYAQITDSRTFSAEGIAAEVRLYRSGYAAITADRLTRQAGYPIDGVFKSILETLPLMLIGMALLKNGFLRGEWEPRRYRAWALWGIGLGGAASAACAWYLTAIDFDMVHVIAAQLAWMLPPRLAMTIGYAAALLLLIGAWRRHGLIARVAAAGRAAFTNYLGTSIAMTMIFYGYGLALYGQVSRAALWPFVIAAWAVMLLWSKPWLDRFHYGPFEWLWRSLARRSLQPMRKRARAQ